MQCTSCWFLILQDKPTDHTAFTRLFTRFCPYRPSQPVTCDDNELEESLYAYPDNAYNKDSQNWAKMLRLSGKLRRHLPYSQNHSNLSLNLYTQTY